MGSIDKRMKQQEQFSIKENGLSPRSEESGRHQGCKKSFEQEECDPNCQFIAMSKDRQ
jgi:hypothetical protein